MRDALASTDGPSEQWSVSIRVVREGAWLRARGEIYDADGLPIADREIEQKGPLCGPLTHAMAIWAALVLDRELQQAQQHPRGDILLAPDPEPPVVAPAAPAAGEGPPLGRPPSVKKPPREVPSANLGMAALGMEGSGTGPLAGGAIYLEFADASPFTFRPALMFATSPDPSAYDYSTQWVAIRLDVCGRMRAQEHHRSLELDLCGGVDLGLHFFQKENPLSVRGNWGSNLSIVIGPALNVRVPLGDTWWLEPRVMGGLNLAKLAQTSSNFVEPQLVIARIELGISHEL